MNGAAAAVQSDAVSHQRHLPPRSFGGTSPSPCCIGNARCCPSSSLQCLSWVFSPILAGGFSIVLFFFIRLIVLRSQHAYQRSLWL